MDLTFSAEDKKAIASIQSLTNRNVMLLDKILIANAARHSNSQVAFERLAKEPLVTKTGARRLQITTCRSK